MWVTIYTDASYCQYTNVATWSFWARSSEGRIVDDGLSPSFVKDSNAAEMMAVYKATVAVLRVWGASEIEGLFFNTDSMNAIHYLKYKSPVVEKPLNKRKEYLRIRSELYILLDNFECKVKFKHVKGHQRKEKSVRTWLNNTVDEKARARLEKGRASVRRSHKKKSTKST